MEEERARQEQVTPDDDKPAEGAAAAEGDSTPAPAPAADAKDATMGEAEENEDDLLAKVVALSSVFFMQVLLVSSSDVLVS